MTKGESTKPPETLALLSEDHPWMVAAAALYANTAKELAPTFRAPNTGIRHPDTSEIAGAAWGRILGIKPTDESDASKVSIQ